MNRTAYFTTDLAIKTFAKLIKAKTYFHGLGNITSGPTIFVINHFTRVETFLLPYYLYHLTKSPVWSLADAGLFKGGLKSYFDLVGVVSTRDPHRDEMIVKTLLTGEANWIIFPEGRMVKNKKLMRGKQYVVGDEQTARSPHTGAAYLALRAEIFRRFLSRKNAADDAELKPFFQALGIKDKTPVSLEGVKIVPINLTYYPIRAHDNILSELAARYVKEPSERLLEELMTEGTMILEGVDIDIHFCAPLDAETYLRDPIISRVLEGTPQIAFDERPDVQIYLKATAQRMMRIYMDRIYRATTVNHDHLFASFLRRKSFRRFHPKDLARETFLMSEYLNEKPQEMGSNLHLAMKESQIHLLTDDRFNKLASFVDLAIDNGCLVRESGEVKKDRKAWSQPLAFHRIRIQNPAEVMANEIEPLENLQQSIRRIAFMPGWLQRVVVARRLYRQDRLAYVEERQAVAEQKAIRREFGSPYLLPVLGRRAGVVLIHSYLSVPQELRECGSYLRRRGFWVYGVRLPGHGTSPENLAKRPWQDWREAVERGYALLDSICRQVFIVGFSAGGMLALELAARLDHLAGVVALCPPYELQNYSRRFMPSMDIWGRLLARLKRSQGNGEFVDFEPEKGEINYHRNPVAGVNQVDKLLKMSRERLVGVGHPTLIVSADRDQVVNPAGAREIFERIGARDKELLTIASEKHNIVCGPGAERVHELIYSFLNHRL